MNASKKSRINNEIRKTQPNKVILYKTLQGSQQQIRIIKQSLKSKLQTILLTFKTFDGTFFCVIRRSIDYLIRVSGSNCRFVILDCLGQPMAHLCPR